MKPKAAAPKAPHPEQAFADHCCELLSAAGRCTAKRMFGGWGVMEATSGRMVGLIANQRLYLKVDAQTKARFLAEGGEAFVYGDKGKPMEMSYVTPPEECMDSPALMAPWARLALEAALRGAAPKPRKAPSAVPSALSAKRVQTSRRGR
jgi:DNA transformation protein and related proteins